MNENKKNCQDTHSFIRICSINYDEDNPKDWKIIEKPKSQTGKKPYVKSKTLPKGKGVY